jgi:hypothetical protein
VTARSHMTQRAQVERNAASGRDRNNQPEAPNWQPLDLTSTYADPRLPCFLWSSREREVDGQVNARIETQMLGVPENAPITPADRIHGIYDRTGTVLDPSIFRILADQRMGRSHRELTLEVVTGAAGAGS